MRCATQRTVLDAPLPRHDAVDLGSDRDHRLDEPVDLAQALALGGFDHQGSGDRERHRRRVEAVVDQPLGDIVDGDSALLGDLAQVEDALVRHQPGIAGVEHREVGVQPVGDVVRGQDRRLRGLGEALRAHQPDVGP